MSNELGQKLNGQLLPEGEDLENNGPPPSQSTRQTIRYLSNKTFHRVAIYTAIAFVSVGCSWLAHFFNTTSCSFYNADYLRKPYEVVSVVFCVASLILGLGSLFALYKAFCRFYASFVYVWQMQKENTEEGRKETHYVNFIVRQVLVIVASTCLVAFLGSQKYGYQSCDYPSYTFIRFFDMYYENSFDFFTSIICLLSIFVGFGACLVLWFKKRE